MIPQRFAPVLFSLLLSGLMSFVVSGISTFHATGPGPAFWRLWSGAWLTAWLTAWLIAFPTVLLAAPLARRAVEFLLVKQQEASAPRSPR